MLRVIGILSPLRDLLPADVAGVFAFRPALSVGSIVAHSPIGQSFAVDLDPQARIGDFGNAAMVAMLIAMLERHDDGIRQVIAMLIAYFPRLFAGMVGSGAMVSVP